MENTKCIICGKEHPEFSLPLKKVGGLWVAQPIGKNCRLGLLRMAGESGKSITIYRLDNSLREAEKRNAERLQFQPFVDAFAKYRKSAPRKAGVSPATY